LITIHSEKKLARVKYLLPINTCLGSVPAHLSLIRLKNIIKYNTHTYIENTKHEGDGQNALKL
jgi:hypothetical protein